MDPLGYRMGFTRRRREITKQPACWLCENYPFELGNNYFCPSRGALVHKVSGSRRYCDFIPIDAYEYHRRLLKKAENIRLWRHRYRETHRKELAAAQRIYYRNHVEEKAEWDRLDRLKRPEHHRQRQHKYYLEHRDKVLEKTWLRRQIEYFDPLRLIKRKFRYARRIDKIRESQNGATRSTEESVRSIG